MSKTASVLSSVDDLRLRTPLEALEMETFNEGKKNTQGKCEPTRNYFLIVISIKK